MTTCSICAGAWWDMPGNKDNRCICAEDLRFAGTQDGEVDALRRMVFRAENDLARVQGKELPYPDVFGSNVLPEPERPPTTQEIVQGLYEGAQAFAALADISRSQYLPSKDNAVHDQAGSTRLTALMERVKELGVDNGVTTQ